MARPGAGGPGVISVVGLGPGGLELLTAGASSAVRDARDAGTPLFFRTGRHPAATALLTGGAAGPNAETFDDHYEHGATFAAVYDSITATLLEVVRRHGRALYAVPGSPLVAERTVELLAARARDCAVELELVPGLSFCDLAWARLELDPVSAGVRLVDGTRFAENAAGDRGPLLVAQCWSNAVLSDVKLSIESPPADQRAIVLHHLGLPDEEIIDVAWEELDRAVEADHLTSLFVQHLSVPVAGELVRLADTVATLRLRCPWDREQTHASLVPHLLEETYEVIEAIEALGDSPSDASAESVAHAEEELGDVLCQVVFHATLAREEGLFELADIARAINDKLVARHPHVFGDVVAETASEVVTNWELSKRREKGRQSLLEGIPASMPSLARAAIIERKLASAGLGWSVAAGDGDAGAGDGVAAAGDGVAGAGDGEAAAGSGDAGAGNAEAGAGNAEAGAGNAEAGAGNADAGAGDSTLEDAGDALLALARALAASGRDPESALRRALDRLVERVNEVERAAAERGRSFVDLAPEQRLAWFVQGPPPA
jgi:tetrapyrrole methylase family protein/MazG family protein